MSSELKWYVVRVVSGQEKKAKAYLETEIQRHKLEDFVAEVLIPSEKVYEMRNGKKRVRERNHFPGYVIVSADLSHGEALHIVTSTPGVIGFLGDSAGANSVPVPLREAEINRILGIGQESEEVEEENPREDVVFLVNEPVTVMDGPFSGFTGVVEEVYDERKKLKVMVKIFGRNTPVELNYIQVEKQD
ncbi:transcription termination/antitermination protein NusG [Persicobacter psychrovividus]|uniref:Transcription termination/antitermination protein NusG n=1 Tax=Persicobacter psychrovividus TaxID=387638 RepID=A0ABN6LA43_9BACT|nr:transcription termination/antitermination protein NusG [Persicobacter psychrovividus]